MTPGVTLQLRENKKLHAQIRDAVSERVKISQNKMRDLHKQWQEAENRALAYLPEREIDAKRRREREQGGKPQYTTIQIPYSYAVMMAAHTYWTTVFMSRTPLLQYQGRHGEGEQQTQALEALMNYQVQVGQMVVPWYIWINDAGKYGIGILGHFWEEEMVFTSEIQEVEEKIFGLVGTGRKRKVKRTRQIPGYVGNKVYNVRPFDWFPDPRVPMLRFQEGEFCAVYRKLGWNTLLLRREQGIYTNLELLKSKASAVAEEQGSPRLELPSTESSVTDGKPPNAAEIFGIYECYVKLVPKEWDLGESNMPEIWVFTVDEMFRVVLGAQPHGAFHGKFPFDILPLEPEGYAFGARGIPKIIEPIQNTLDWLINSHFYNVRKVLNDMFVVDPSRVVLKDLDFPGPGGYVRLRPSAYGTDVSSVLQQLPINDVTAQHVRDLQVMLSIGERTMGISDQLMGALNTGGSNRKTATEVRTSSTFGINRLKTISEFFSAVGWSPMSQKLVQNSQQYYDLERKFRIVGDLAQDAGRQFMEVTPGDIQGFYDFVPVDGTLPIDRFAQANLWRELLNQMRQSPDLAARYDVGRIFEWVAQLAGLKNISQFRIELVSDEAAAQQAERGNVVPLGDVTRVPEPGQVGGMGTTG